MLLEVSVRQCQLYGKGAVIAVHATFSPWLYPSRGAETTMTVEQVHTVYISTEKCVQCSIFTIFSQMAMFQNKNNGNHGIVGDGWSLEHEK